MLWGVEDNRWVGVPFTLFKHQTLGSLVGTASGLFWRRSYLDKQVWSFCFQRQEIARPSFHILISPFPVLPHILRTFVMSCTYHFHFHLYSDSSKFLDCLLIVSSSLYLHKGDLRHWHFIHYYYRNINSGFNISHYILCVKSLLSLLNQEPFIFSGVGA